MIERQCINGPKDGHTASLGETDSLALFPCETRERDGGDVFAVYRVDGDKLVFVDYVPASSFERIE
jgi:hypothetical protein